MVVLTNALRIDRDEVVELLAEARPELARTIHATAIENLERAEQRFKRELAQAGVRPDGAPLSRILR
jgi:hypothetical protein